MSAFYDKIKNASDIYVIAEVGSNYKLEQDLVSAVSFAKACGADAVKFQYFDKSELFGPVAKINPDNPLPRLKAKADAVGIDLICSSFSPEGMKEVDPFVVAHKIASSEMSHLRMLEMAKTLGKPIILSTGAYFATDIKRAMDFLVGAEVIPLHCNVSYPARFTDVDKFAKLLDAYTVVGFSDHTTSIDAVPMFFQAAGAKILEKHFNPFNLDDTPDAKHSLNVDEFKTMVSYLRGAPKPYSEENEARMRHVRRVIATADMKVGETLKEGVNMGIFRSKVDDANGINPFFIGRLEGKKLTKEKREGEGLSMGDVG